MKTLLRILIATILFTLGMVFILVPLPLLTPVFLTLALIVIHPQPRNNKWFARLLQQMPMLVTVHQVITRFIK
ncbi:MAG: hypothetical protein D6677_11610 [Calditrichaeota bacterium]|nr:MAG: hypothetical protein D6677_11610 [Calditrichota bacterium]